MTDRIHDLIRTAWKSSHSIAAIEGMQTHSFTEIEVLASQVAAALRREGIEKGDHVCLAFPNSVPFVFSLLGVMSVGAVPVPVSLATPAHKLAYILNDVGAVAYLGEEWLISQVDDEKVPSLRIVSSGRTDRSDSSRNRWIPFRRIRRRSVQERPAALPASDNSAIILYTSGTTGRPKGVRLSHENLAFATDFMIRSLRLGPKDRSLISIDFAHCAGLLHLLAHLRCGGSVVLGQTVVMAVPLLKTLKLRAVTGLPTVPSMIALLLNQYKREFMEYCSTLRYIELSSAPYTSQLIKELLRCLPSTHVLNTYGLTEAPRLTYQNLRSEPEAILSVGKENPSVTVKILDGEGRPCSEGKHGELFVSGPTLALGYWNRQHEEVRRFTPNGYATGDIGYRDAQRRIYLLGRRDEMIKSGAERIYPLEIEEVIHSMGGVDEVVVYGVQDELYGERIKAKIVASDRRIKERDVIQFCRRHLERYKVPQLVEFCSSLPRTEAGKIDRRVLDQV